MHTGTMEEHQADLVTAINSNSIAGVFSALQSIRNSVKFPCADIRNYTAPLQRRFPEISSDVAALLTLFEIELWLFYSESSPERSFIEEKFKAISLLTYSSTPNELGFSPYSKYKYHDLITDYQHLYSIPPGQLSLMELVNKKLNFLPSTSTQHVPSNLLAELKRKIHLLSLLSGSDFRKENVYKYLDTTNVHEESFDEISAHYRQLQADGRLASLGQFDAFINHVQSVPGVFPYLVLHYKTQLIENFLDCNICKLPKYYISIRFDRINKLLQRENASDSVDIEDLLYRMITGGKLPEGTTIDQVAGVLRFGSADTGYGRLDSHILSVSKVINSVCPAKSTTS